MHECGTCKYFLGCGDWCLCCEIHPWLCYSNDTACDDWVRREEKGLAKEYIKILDKYYK